MRISINKGELILFRDMYNILEKYRASVYYLHGKEPYIISNYITYFYASRTISDCRDILSELLAIRANFKQCDTIVNYMTRELQELFRDFKSTDSKMIEIGGNCDELNG